jgi:alpha,alpha-trehalase
LELLKVLPADHSKEICERLKLTKKELALWERVSKKMLVPILDNGIISEFSGYEALPEFPCKENGKPDNKEVDRVLKEQGGTLNNFKISKQPDVLMLFYLFSHEELTDLFKRLGYDFSIEMIEKNIDLYVRRTANTSTLSRVALTWVLSRMDRENAWNLLSSMSSKTAVRSQKKHESENDYPNPWEIFREALGSDYTDIQGGTTAEGIHLGAMGGTVDIVQRCYTGIVTRDDVLWLNPRLPKEMIRLAFQIQYRHQVVQLEITRKTTIVSTGFSSAEPVKIGFKGKVYEFEAGQRRCFKMDDASASASGT